jgi:hypothetical protein
MILKNTSKDVGTKFPSGYIHKVDLSAQRIHPFGIGPERICPFGIGPRSGVEIPTA